MAASAKLYEQFEPPERLTLLLEAMARGDDAEAERIGASCPWETYTQRDVAFTERMDLAFDTMAVVCIDLRGLWGKLDILHWAMAAAREMATHHQITAAFAFLEGERCGKRKPQLEFFARPPRDATTEAADEVEEEDDGDDHGAAAEQPNGDEDENEDGPRLSTGFDGDVGRRMAAVEDRMQRMTDDVFVSLLKAAHDLALQLVNVWEAFGRFCRTRLGVAPETMLDAWGFPIAGDFKDMLKRYEYVKPDPAKVEEYFGYICTTWDKRFGE